MTIRTLTRRIAKRTAEESEIIRDHYGLKRPITDDEREKELASLIRKHMAGSLDDMDERLAARLGLI